MNRIEFVSNDPFDHACRVLDTVRKMGFRLGAMLVEPRPDGAFRVEVSFHTAGDLTAETLVHRVLNLEGILCPVCHTDKHAPSLV